MNFFFQITAILLTSLVALATIPVFVRLQQPVAFVWWGVKVFVSALSAYLAMAAALGIMLGIFTGPLWAVVPGGYAALFFLIYIYRANAAVTTSNGFVPAYWPGWESSLAPERKTYFLTNGTPLTLPVTPEPRLTQNIPFCEIPGTGRQLLCDVWQPSEGVKHSGLAFIYFHGSAWCVLDKDFGTRPFFRHLTAQGHVVMDVAYRLFPETDMAGMAGDVYRAIAWMKDKAGIYNINPDRLVIGGASAGGHLALLAAYNSTNLHLIPAELQGLDVSVHAVISEYGPPDLSALYYHTGQHITTRRKNDKQEAKPAETPQWVRKMMGESFHRLGMDKDGSSIGVLPVILGCHPDDNPELYASFSPITYVQKGCPQTLIIQGSHDLITPVLAARRLFKRLTEAGVPAVMFIIPQTDHAFDLILPRLSPVAHTAYYAVERFLALQVENFTDK